MRIISMWTFLSISIYYISQVSWSSLTIKLIKSRVNSLGLTSLSRCFNSRKSRQSCFFCKQDVVDGGLLTDIRQNTRKHKHLVVAAFHVFVVTYWANLLKGKWSYLGDSENWKWMFIAYDVMVIFKSDACLEQFTTTKYFLHLNFYT